MQVDYEDYGCSICLRGGIERVLSSNRGNGWPGIFFRDLVFAGDGSVSVEQAGVQFVLSVAPRDLVLNCREQALRFDNDFLAVFAPGSSVSGSWKRAFRTVTLQLAPETVERLSDLSITRLGLRTQFVADEAERTARHLLLTVAADLEADCPTGWLLAESVATSLLRSFSDGQRSSPRRSPALTSQQAAKIRDFILAHASKHISLQQLAEEVGISIGHLVRAFKGSFGVTPYQYVLRVRVRLAREMIKTGGRSLAEVARETGFVDQSRMTKTFRRVTGQTPTAAKPPQQSVSQTRQQV